MFPQPLALRNCLCANVRKTDRMLSRVYDQALRPTGLTAHQFALLSVLAEGGPLRITNLAHVMAMDQTTVTRNVDLLKKQGMVDAAPTSDKRVRAVALTDRGRQTHAQALPLWSGLQAQLTTALGSERWGQFLLDLSLIRGLVSGTLPQEDA